MSTRANIIIRDECKQIQIYKHSDGYPSGAIPAIQKALALAWPLPRWEADDFAAAFVAANKDRGGQIYIDGTWIEGKTEHGDIEYLYFVEFDADQKMVKITWGKSGKVNLCWIASKDEARIATVEIVQTEKIVSTQTPDELYNLLDKNF